MASKAADVQNLVGLTKDAGVWHGRARHSSCSFGVFNVPRYTSHVESEQSPIRNSIFVFRTGELCLVHLGNLQPPLPSNRLQRLGRPNVVMIPADGSWTMSFEDVLTVIKQLYPSLVIPMHIDTPLYSLMALNLLSTA